MVGTAILDACHLDLRTAIPYPTPMADYTEKPKNWKDLPPEELAAFMTRKSEGYLPALLGFTLTSVTKDRVAARMPVEKHHLAPND